MTTQMQSTRATAQTGDPVVRLTELGKQVTASATFTTDWSADQAAVASS
jgi:hypothetical protein